jgi:hypothetical protein
VHIALEDAQLMCACVPAAQLDLARAPAAGAAIRISATATASVVVADNPSLIGFTTTFPPGLQLGGAVVLLPRIQHRRIRLVGPTLSPAIGRGVNFYAL